MIPDRFQAEATTIVGLAGFVGITMALVLSRVSLDTWLAVSSTCLVLIGVPQRAPTPSPVPTPVAPAGSVPAEPATQEKP